MNESLKSFKSTHSYSVIYPFLILFLLLFFLIEIPSVIIGWFISDISYTIRFGALILIVPYFFVILAILRQVGTAEIILKEGKIIYKESTLSRIREVLINDIDRVNFSDRFNPIYKTHETLSFLGKGGTSVLTVNLEKFSGENIKDFLIELKAQNPYMKFDEKTNMLLG